MKESARYVKIVEWSDEDQCFVGSCPGLFYGGCHGGMKKKSLRSYVKLWTKQLSCTRKTANRCLPLHVEKTTPIRCWKLSPHPEEPGGREPRAGRGPSAAPLVG